MISKRILWLLVSFVMVLSLVMASCAPSSTPPTPTTPSTPTTPTTPTAPTAPTTPTTPTTPVAEAPKYGGVLTGVLTASPRGWDTAITRHHMISGSLPVGRQLLVGDWTRGPAGTGEFGFFASDGLFETKMGCLAESWEFFPDGHAIYKIRQGVRYALDPASEASRLVGGRELTATDVAYSLNRMITTPGTYINTNVPIVTKLKVTALDKYTIEVVNVPEQFFQTQFYLDFYTFGDQPREVVEKYGNMEKWRNVVGTGPMILTDYVPDSLIGYVRNTNYFMKNPVGPGKGDQIPYVDSLKYLIVPDASTRIAALRTGKIDFMSSVILDDAKDLNKTAPQLLWKQGMSTGASVIYMRTDLKELPYKDIRVRQALTMGIDYDTMNKTLYGGLGRVPSWPVVYQPEMARYYIQLEDLDERTKELYTYNPEKAKQLLKEAGYPNGFKASLICPTTAVDYVAIVKDMWKKIGVELTLDVKEASIITSYSINRNHPDMIYGSTGSTNLIWYPGGAGNVDEVSTFNLSMIDQQYIKDARNAMHTAWLKGNMDEYYKIIRDDLLENLLWEAWGVPMHQTPIFTFWQPWLKNFYGATSPGAFTPPPFEYVWIDQELKKSMGH